MNFALALQSELPNVEATPMNIQNARFSIDYVAKDSRSSSGWKGIGCQLVDELPPGRKTCSEGMENFTLTENIELLKGHQLVTIKASPKKPITGYTIIYPLGGERTFVHPMDAQ